MILTPDQDRALRAIRQWRDAGCPTNLFRLTGYAGTGKSTLLRYVRDLFANVVTVTMTAKAASVARAKGVKNATNIHQLIYRHIGSDDEDNPLFEDNGDMLKERTLILIDEASMMCRTDLAALQRRGIPILAVGDPGQLQPVAPNGVTPDPWFVGYGDAHLDQVIRQASDSVVLRAATAIRNGQINAGFRMLDFRPATSVAPAELMACDQVLCWKNETRQDINRQCRAVSGWYESDRPEIGDRVICRQNNHALKIYNGTQGVIEDVTPSSGVWRFQLALETNERKNVRADPAGFAQVKPPRDESGKTVALSYAYALTVHSAQGSEWPRVAIRLPGPSTNLKEWAYTAVTRASDSALVAY